MLHCNIYSPINSFDSLPVRDTLLARGLTIMTNTIKTTKNPYATMAYQNTRYTWPHMWHR